MTISMRKKASPPASKSESLPARLLSTRLQPCETRRTPSLRILEGVALPSLMDSIADHVLAARELAHQGHERALLTILDVALTEIGFRLAQQMDPA